MESAAQVAPEALQDRVSRLSLLYELGRSFSELIELEELIPVVIGRTRELLRAESCAILMLDEDGDHLYFLDSADVAPEVEKRFARIRFPADQGIAGWVLQHGVAQVVNDVSRDRRWYSAVDAETGQGTKSLLCAPLRSRRGVLGVIELRNHIQGQFSSEDLEFLDALAGSIAIALENARQIGRLRQTEEKLREEVVVLHREVSQRHGFDNVIGTSPVMYEVFRLMERAAESPVTVLLQGETGTGKGLIAAAIHYNSARAAKPLVKVNCGGVAESLLDSELFGHKKGSFTGATGEKKGLFDAAHTGTIFLDEIGETSPAMQVKLLRVLEEGELLPVGGTEPRRVDVRVISATHRDLESEVKKGAFREDLYYRLSSFPIRVPTLRERPEDVPLLAMHLLHRTATRFQKAVTGFSAAALDCVAGYRWPGNVRELANEVERAVAMVRSGALIRPEHLSEKLTMTKLVRVPLNARSSPLKDARELFEKEYIAEVLRQHGGKATETAKALRISRVMLYKKIKRYKLRRK